MTLKSFGPLSATVIEPAADEAAERTVVLLHGYGAPGTDLVGLERALSTSRPTRFVYLMAPHVLAGYGGPDAGRAWWHIDMMALQIARMSGEHDELAKQDPDGRADANRALGEALADLLGAYGCEMDSIVLGGFSQGAMLCCDYALRALSPPQALVLLSGTVLCEPEWVALMKERAGLPVFQSHSPEDMVLPYSLAERLAAHMKAAGMQHKFVSFPGGHGIGPSVLTELRHFLESTAV